MKKPTCLHGYSFNILYWNYCIVYTPSLNIIYSILWYYSRFDTILILYFDVTQLRMRDLLYGQWWIQGLILWWAWGNDPFAHPWIRHCIWLAIWIRHTYHRMCIKLYMNTNTISYIYFKYLSILYWHTNIPVYPFYHEYIYVARNPNNFPYIPTRAVQNPRSRVAIYLFMMLVNRLKNVFV